MVAGPSTPRSLVGRLRPTLVVRPALGCVVSLCYCVHGSCDYRQSDIFCNICRHLFEPVLRNKTNLDSRFRIERLFFSSGLSFCYFVLGCNVDGVHFDCIAHCRPRLRAAPSQRIQRMSPLRSRT